MKLAMKHIRFQLKIKILQCYNFCIDWIKFSLFVRFAFVKNIYLLTLLEYKDSIDNNKYFKGIERN